MKDMYRFIITCLYCIIIPLLIENLQYLAQKVHDIFDLFSLFLEYIIMQIYLDYQSVMSNDYNCRMVLIVLEFCFILIVSFPHQFTWILFEFRLIVVLKLMKCRRDVEWMLFHLETHSATSMCEFNVFQHNGAYNYRDVS